MCPAEPSRSAQQTPHRAYLFWPRQQSANPDLQWCYLLAEAKPHLHKDLNPSSIWTPAIFPTVPVHCTISGYTTAFQLHTHGSSSLVSSHIVWWASISCLRLLPVGLCTCRSPKMKNTPTHSLISNNKKTPTLEVQTFSNYVVPQ